MTDVVSYSATFTRNMGDYESLKLGVGISTELRDDETEVDALKRAKEFVGEALFSEVDDVESQVRGVRTAAEQRKIAEAKK